MARCFDLAGLGWTLAPAFDLNLPSAALKARVLGANIDLDEGTWSLELLISACGFFELNSRDARAIIKGGLR